MKRYSDQALVSLPPQDVAGLEALSPGSASRMVIRGRHHETGASRFFSALLTTSADTVPEILISCWSSRWSAMTRMTTFAQVRISRCGAAMISAAVC